MRWTLCYLTFSSNKCILVNWLVCSGSYLLAITVGTLYIWHHGLICLADFLFRVNQAVDSILVVNITDCNVFTLKHPIWYTRSCALLTTVAGCRPSIQPAHLEPYFLKIYMINVRYIHLGPTLPVLQQKWFNLRLSNLQKLTYKNHRDRK